MISQQQLKALLQGRKIGLNAPEALVELPEGPIFHVLIKGGSHALNQWQQARDLVGVTGLYPVIVESKEVMMTEILEGFMESAEVETAEIVRQAQEMDTMQVLANGLYYQEINNTGKWREWSVLSEDGSGRIPVEVFSAADPRTHLPWIEEVLGPWPENIDPEDFPRC